MTRFNTNFAALTLNMVFGNLSSNFFHPVYTVVKLKHDETFALKKRKFEVLTYGVQRSELPKVQTMQDYRILT